uniref:RNA binding motif protein 41 n=1 Tax=Equus caballus TaxID=9796 RepID=A0A9L0RTC7_HORSE
MKRVNSCVKSDEHVLEELETEGERQLKSLLQHQLDTSVSIEECVSKKESFAPGTMYKPFGKEAAGTMTLSQFQTLHEKDQETASLRELGLNETEILIWKSHVSGEKRTRLRATPEAIQNRLQDIEERISERQRILCLPQRFAKSKQLTRREMEIEKSLFQGADRHSFLKALYYQDKEIAWQALHLVNGYKLRGKILVIEFGKNKKQRSNLQAASVIPSATDKSTEISGS